MAVDHFLKIEGIEGESEDQEHKGWIDLLSWSWGAHSGRHDVPGRGRRRRQGLDADFHFTMRVCKASPEAPRGLRQRRALRERHARRPQGGQDAAEVPQDQVHGPSRLLVRQAAARAIRSRSTRSR